MPRRFASIALVAAVLLAAPIRRRLEAPPALRTPCRPEGKGIPPRHWLGCAADPGPSRALVGEERLALGLPLDPNVASARELAYVPGLSPRLAAAIVADRARRGPFRTVDDLDRVRGIGPKRLGLARASLEVAAHP